jgi:hypothetical protein
MEYTLLKVHPVGSWSQASEVRQKMLNIIVVRHSVAQLLIKPGACTALLLLQNSMQDTVLQLQHDIRNTTFDVSRAMEQQAAQLKRQMDPIMAGNTHTQGALEQVN